MRVGYYKRPREILESLENGEISLLESAIHDFLCLKANAIVGSTKCSIPPGIVFISAPALHALCPRLGSSLRSIQRGIERLESIGAIKRWTTPGKRGNYPVLLARWFTVADQSGNVYEINAAETVDWHHPKLERVTELSPIRRGRGSEASPYTEVKKGEERISPNHHPSQDQASKNETDDDRDSDSDPIEKLQEKAAAELVSRGEDPGFVAAAIKYIDQRSFDLGTTPVTSNYYHVAFDRLKHNSQEMAELWSKVKRSRTLREKYMSNFTGKPEDEAARQEFNRQMAAKHGNAAS